jgi:hypothetical protein
MIMKQQMSEMRERVAGHEDEREERMFHMEEQREEHHMQLQMQHQFMSTMMMILSGRNMFSVIPSHREEEKEEISNQEGKEEEE